MKTFALAALVGTASAYTPLPDYVKSLPYANGAYDCSTCSASVKAQLDDRDFRSDKKEGWHDAEGWTPWVNRDAPTGTGDHESFEALNQKHNLCGVNNELGGFFGPIKAECVTGAGLTPSQAGQTATCGLGGLKCLNADNQKCFGADAKCAAANTATGNNRHGISNAEDQCREHAIAHGCHWGCYDYSVRFQCEKSWTKAPTPMPTTAPTNAPTFAPTMAPTPAPTPAPSPRGLVESKEAHAAGKPGGLMASKGIEFHTQFSLINNGGFSDGTTSWRANLEGTVVKAHENLGKHWLTVKSSQLGDTPGVFQYLDIPGKDKLKGGQQYLVSIKGKGASTQWAEKWNAKPFVECNVGGTRQQMLSVNAEPLPPSDGTCINRFTPATDATECRAGVLFFGTKPTSEMTLEQFEVRPMFKHEELVLNEDIRDRQHGIIANHNFAHGSQFWGRINARDEVWSNGKDLVVWNHGKPAGQHTGVQQTGLMLKAGERYRFALKGRVDRNGQQFGNAVLFVSKTTRDHYGNTKTVDMTSSVGLQGLKMRLSTQGTTTRYVDFTASAADASLAQVTYNVGARFDGLTPAGVEMFLEDSKLDLAPKNTAEETRLTDAEEKAYHAELDAKRVARNTQACNCSPRVHSSKATKCFAEQSGFAQRANVIRVVHRKSMLAPDTFENIGMDQADSHKCEMVDNACKCCDCKEGQTHGFDLKSLKDGRKFTVRFDRAFANNAGNVKPGMTGTCRYFEGKWCCACTNSYLGAKGDKTENRCPYTYGQEFCNAYTGTRNPQGINFWGRNYHFKEYHRCVTPSMHHNCGEGVKADGSLKQDIGHLPYFDNNGKDQGDGFAIVNNAQELVSTLDTYIKTTDKTSICASTGVPQVGGLQGNQVLSADTCAALCDNEVSCKAFNYHVSTGTSDTKCEFITQVGNGCLKSKANVFYYQKKPVPASQL